MAFELPTLPYSKTALGAKGMCEETLDLHHGKHHQAYVTALNGFVEKDPSLQGKSLEDIVKLSHNKPDMAPVFNNAGQHWNHILFWQCMSPNGGGIPGALENEDQRPISATSRSSRTRSRPAASASSAPAGSGWCSARDGKLKVTRSPNGSNPLATGEGKVLLGCDVWEHSYYLDFRNRPAGLSAELGGQAGELRIRRSAAEGGIAAHRGTPLPQGGRGVLVSPPSPSPAWHRSPRSAGPRWRSSRAAPSPGCWVRSPPRSRSTRPACRPCPRPSARAARCR